MSTNSNVIMSSWLTKSPPAKNLLFRPRWRRRWFELKTGTFPNQFVLEYFTDESCRRQKGQINLDECEQVAAPLAVQDRHKFTFNLRTPNRVYYLAADTELEMNKWVQCLCHVCGLKTVDEDTEMYTKPPGDENNQPDDTENRESDESSPSLSNHTSGPYIPISECYTGKPIRLNDKFEPTYDRFVFPPEVNWATHPTKREDSDSEQSHAGITPQSIGSAPPRPPKKFSPSVISTGGSVGAPTINSPRSCNNDNMSKTLSLPSSTRTVFPYDNSEEVDSSSTCSSLHSPPGSAGVLYSNIAEISPIYQNPGSMSSGNNNPIAQLNPIPSPGDPTVPSPPKVDRNLKPDLRKTVESPSYKSNHLHHHLQSASSASPTSNFGNRHSNGSMTLPSSRVNSRSNGSIQGPIVDRCRKPESPITLGPTPVQIKSQAGNNNNIIHNNNNSISSSTRYGPSLAANTNTLPASRRRAGPPMSPHDKKPPVYPYNSPDPYEPTTELTYLQIDCKSVESEPKSINSKGPTHHKMKNQASSLEDNGSVEYRLIDHVKTMALNQIRIQREEQLRTRPSNH